MSLFLPTCGQGLSSPLYLYPGHGLKAAALEFSILAMRNLQDKNW